MSSIKSTNNAEFNIKFFYNVAPTRLTESRRLKLHTEGWGLLTEYYLESVKIYSHKAGVVNSCATLRVGDRAGQVTCVVKGPTIGLLFGLSAQTWSNIEKLCEYGQQLFYRYFKEGLNKNFGFEQKIFYNFCLTNQKNDIVLVAIFRRLVNKRNRDKSDAFLDIIELRKCDLSILDLYVNHLKMNIDNC